MIYILAGIIVFQTIMHHFERRDLYSRIMCKGMDEYKNINTKPIKYISSHERVLKRWRGSDEK